MSNEQQLKQAAYEMLGSYTTKIESLAKEPASSPLRYNIMGWQDQAVEFIVEMAKTFSVSVFREELTREGAPDNSIADVIKRLVV